MRAYIKYLIFFFVIFNFLTIGELASLRYNSFDYSRTGEFVRKVDHKKKNSCFKYIHFFINSSNFQAFIFNISDYKSFTTAIIKIKVKKQNSIKFRTGIYQTQFLKPIRLNNAKESKNDLYENGDSKERIHQACKLFHVMIIKMLNQLSFSKCINQKTKVSGLLKKSGRYLDG